MKLPDFDSTCDYFQLDEYEAKAIAEFRSESSSVIGTEKHHLPSEKLMAAGLYVGLILIFISAIIAIILYMQTGRFPRLSLFLFLIGGVAVTRDLLGSKK